MKFSSLLSLSILSIALLAGSPARAASLEVDFLNKDYNMDIVVAGQYGDIDTKTFYDGGYHYDFVKGSLPSNMTITFTYLLNDNLYKKGYAETIATYDDDIFRYKTGAATDGWSINKKSLIPFPFYWNTSDVLDVTTTATLSDDKKTATLTITNLSDTLANFKSYFFSCCKLCGNVVATSYQVSNVPLPAALPLFGLAVAGLAGARRIRNRK